MVRMAKLCVLKKTVVTDKTTLRVIRRLGGGKGDVSVCGGATSHWQVLRKAMPSFCALDAGMFLDSPCPPLELDGQRELEAAKFLCLVGIIPESVEPGTFVLVAHVVCFGILGIMRIMIGKRVLVVYCL